MVIQYHIKADERKTMSNVTDELLDEFFLLNFVIIEEYLCSLTIKVTKIKSIACELLQANFKRCTVYKYFIKFLCIFVTLHLP